MTFSRRQALQMAALVTTSLWAKSCEWERCPELWKRQWADVLRHSDVVLVNAISLICGGGWEGMSAATGTFLSAGFIQHLDKYGPVK